MKVSADDTQISFENMKVSTKLYSLQNENSNVFQGYNKKKCLRVRKVTSKESLYFRQVIFCQQALAFAIISLMET